MGEDFVRIGENQYVVYAAVSDWMPPAAIGSLARGQTVPYELTASAPSFGHFGTSPGFWGTYRQQGLQRTQSGSFNAVASGRKGLLRVDPENRWHFIWEGTSSRKSTKSTATRIVDNWSN